jgi:hypothetical protein
MITTPTPPPTDDSLAAWIEGRRRLASEATPGPWIDRTFAVFDGDPFEDGRQVAYCGTAMSNRETDVIEQDQRNNAYIAAHDPATVTLMLDVIVAAERRRQAWIAWGACADEADCLDAGNTHDFAVEAEDAALDRLTEHLRKAGGR